MTVTCGRVWWLNESRIKKITRSKTGTETKNSERSGVSGKRRGENRHETVVSDCSEIYNRTIYPVRVTMFVVSSTTIVGRTSIYPKVIA